MLFKDSKECPQLRSKIARMKKKPPIKFMTVKNGLFCAIFCRKLLQFIVFHPWIALCMFATKASLLKCAKFITIIFNLAFTKKPIERCQFLFSWSFFASMCIKAHYPLPIMHFFICSLKLFCARFDAYVDSIHNDFLFVVVIVVFAIFSVYSAVDIHFWNCVHY